MFYKGEITEEQKDEEIKKVEMYTFTTREMLDFMDTLNENNIEAFYNYLDERFNKIKEEFYRLNDISQECITK